MSIWGLLAIVFVAGGIGGAVNALISDNGFALPQKTAGILRPGWMGNALIGAIGAAVSWSLYGPLASAAVFSTNARGAAAQGELTLAAIGGAILVGIGGARWLTNEVDKKLLRATASEAAALKEPTDSLASAIQHKTPAGALQAVQALAAQERGSPVLEPGPVLKRERIL